MMDHVHCDFETRSACDLTKCGSDVYSQDYTTDVLCLAYAFDESPVKLWTPEETPPDDLLRHVVEGGKVIGYNIGGFELLIWNNVMAIKYGWPELSIDQCEDTMARSYAMALPGSLNDSSLAVGINYKKDMKGHRVMLQLSQPRSRDTNNIVWWDKTEVPEKYQTIYEYCKQDVEVERELHKRLMPLPLSEQKLWALDYEINRRGVYVDRDSALTAIEVVKLEQDRLNQEMRRITSNAVVSCTATGQLTDWLKLQGLEVPSVAKADVLELLDKDIPDVCRKALLLRQEAAKTSTAKLASMIKGSSLDGRMKGLFQYHGASTGRWAGRRVQLQNLKRPSISQEKIDGAFELLAINNPVSRVPELIRDRIGAPMSVLSDCTRGFLRAKPGHDFIGCDFSSIEARVLAWLAHEERILEIFKTHGKIYEHAASGIYNIPLDEVNKDQRQIGKVAVLALGYGGGKGAFQTLAKGYGVKITDEQADLIKLAWREANPNIVKYWYALEQAASDALRNPGKKFSAGKNGRAIWFIKSGSFLWAKLPSGRTLCYPYPKFQEVTTPWGDTREAITYMSVDSFTKKWARLSTYGGKLSENITQAVARDLLSESLFRLEDKGYHLVAHVHDEVLVEIKKSFGSVEEVENIMSETPAWAEGLPVAAEGWRGERYRK